MSNCNTIESALNRMLWGRLPMAETEPMYAPYVPVRPLADRRRYQLYFQWMPCDRYANQWQLRVSLPGIDSWRFTRVCRVVDNPFEFRKEICDWAFRAAAVAISDFIRLHPETKFEQL